MLSSFVNLEELAFYKLNDHTAKTKTIHVRSSSLKSYPKEAAIQSVVVQFVTNISSTVKILALSRHILQDLFDASNNNVPSFPNLKQLVVKYIISGMSYLLNMLRILPNLKVLVLNKCLNSSVERLEFKGYGGCSAEMKILEYILRNAKALKKFYIVAYCSINSEEPYKQELLNKLSVLPKTCQVKIEWLRY
ncbi:putative F-box/FBD/LRR-repeat protein At5g22670 [Mercurialis annua]|uniref:putative F-box/FBD/LRR-repeat protein At5g22670 n=1 Tax=Mercurialis annua TaxID=3986 RepID=UPI00215EFA80|nr:putative F-box/FBD/LRR-repeat protein At5g22670 [Mercurialis annua]